LVNFSMFAIFCPLFLNDIRNSSLGVAGQAMVHNPL
jgi:hypothetical protein